MLCNMFVALIRNPVTRHSSGQGEQFGLSGEARKWPAATAIAGHSGKEGRYR